MYRADTIVACATAAGRGAVAIVRCSGPMARGILSRVFRARAGVEPEPWRMRLGTILAADGCTTLDEALAVFFPAPHSFTGEDTMELHCHGSPVVVEEIVASIIAHGARAAERGEFARRAVLNGKLDLLQAEAIADLIDAKMAAGARASWNQLQGALSRDLGSLRSSLVAVLADIEASVDFTDDELPDPDPLARARAIDAVLARIEELLRGFPAARRQREGLRIVFTGRPNAGKSSLINRLLGSGRMIVSDEPGTTRDVVDEVVDLGGIAFVLTDTAGLRDAAGAAESQAVERARATLEDADLRVFVLDASRAPGPDDDEAWGRAGGADLVLLNKADLGVAGGWSGRFAGCDVGVLLTSAATGDGCDALVEALVAAARQRLESQPAGISRLRHRSALERTMASLRAARELAVADDRSELTALELRGALAELAAISEPVGAEDVLDRIFSEFCIGK